MKELCQETYAAAKAQKESLAEKIQILLLPKDPNDEKNVIMEIRGGVGGEESACLPTVCCGCTPCTPRKWAGALS